MPSPCVSFFSLLFITSFRWLVSLRTAPSSHTPWWAERKGTEDKGGYNDAENDDSREENSDNDVEDEDDKNEDDVEVDNEDNQDDDHEGQWGRGWWGRQGWCWWAKYEKYRSMGAVAKYKHERRWVRQFVSSCEVVCKTTVLQTFSQRWQQIVCSVWLYRR